MKRLLAFVLLLAAALVALRWLEEPQPDPEPAPPTDVPVTPPPGVPEVEGPAQEAPAQAGPSLSGAFRYRLRSDQEPHRYILDVRSEDSRTLAEYDELLVVLLDQFDPTSGDRQAELEAASARFLRAGLSETLLPTHHPRMELQEVHGTLLAGLRLVPMTIDTAKAVIDWADEGDRRLTSEVRTVVDSPWLHAEGLGLLARIDRRTTVLRSDGHLTFARDEEGPASAKEPVDLRCRGPLEILEHEEKGPDGKEKTAVEIHAREDVVLELGADVLTAGDLRIFGHTVEGEKAEFVLERLVAGGQVVWTLEAGKVTGSGEHASLFFDDAGALERWSIEGNPTLSVSLGVLEGVELPGGASADGSEVVIITGRGPLTGSARGTRRFSMAGPAEVQTGAVTLKALGGVSGNLEEGDHRAAFTAKGGVELHTGEDTANVLDDVALETTELHVEIRREDDGIIHQNITTLHGAKLEGLFDAVSPFTLTSTGHIKAEYVVVPATKDKTGKIEVTPATKSWFVHEAKGVVLALEGPRGFTARADDVTDFDPMKVTLRAHGNVSIESDAGNGAGEVLVVAGPRSFRIEGTPEKKAWLARPDGRAEAGHVELEVVEDEQRTWSQLTARGQVKADFHREVDPDRGYEGYEVRCDDLVVDVVEASDVATGLSDRTLTVDAKIAVDATVGWGGERTRVTCDTLHGSRAEKWQGKKDAGADHRPVLLGASSELTADGRVISHLTYDDTNLDLNCRHLVVTQAERVATADKYNVLATGKVGFEIQMTRAAKDAAEESGANATDADASIPEQLTLSGEGERLTFDQSLSGALEPLPGERVLVVGHLVSQNAPFELRADRFDYRGAEEFTAVRPDFWIRQFDSPGESMPLDALGLRTTAARMGATPEYLEFVDEVNIRSWTKEGAPWSLDSDRLTLRGRAGATASDVELKALEARGRVRFDLGESGKRLEDSTIAEATGDSLEADSIWGTLELVGTPARIESPAFVSEAEWIDFDPALKLIVATGRGSMSSHRAPDETGAEPWRLEYLAFTTFLTSDEILYALREPHFKYPQSKAAMRASWALFWIDRARWEELPTRKDEEGAETSPLHVSQAGPPPVYPDGSPMAKLLEFLRDRSIEDLIREVYLEGPVDMFENGNVVGEADALYFDALSGHGSVVGSKFKVSGEAIGRDFDQLSIRTGWLYHAEDGSIRAKNATISTNPYEVPGVSLVAGSLLVAPVPTDAPGDKPVHEVILRDNRIDFYDRVSLPLPPIRFRTDEEYKPAWQSLRIADSARFGTLVSAGISRPAGKVGETINQVMGGDPDDYDAHWSLHASYLGSRGALFDLGLDVESKPNYGIDTTLGIVPDSGKDRGYIRVDEGDRDAVRLWFRADSRFDLGEEEWVDVTVSKQSDAGVQSEFWEGDFERYERDESYVQWRRARGENYFDIAVKARTEEFRSDIDELPSVGLYYGRAPFLHLGPLALLHTGNTRAAYLSRRAGESEMQSPFNTRPILDAFDEFADGFGDRTLARFDTDQRIEAPFGLGVAGVRATPFLDTRFTAWSEGRDVETRPRRFFAEGGMRFATTFWRDGAAGSTHFLSPFLEVGRELGFEATGNPVPFDAAESPLGGDRVSLGLRTRLDVDEDGPWLDLELRNTYATGLRDGTMDGWLPLEAFGSLRIEPWGVPARIVHEGRYDLDSGWTSYARTRIASRITEDLGVEAGHRVARDSATQRLLETASISGIYRWTEKWEFEGKETFSLLNSNALDTRFLLRRYGADVIFEIESSFREGEGASFGISIRPRVGWRASRSGEDNG